jgi:hypothetical protein
VGNSEEAVKAFANATHIDQGDETTGKMMRALLASELYRYDEAAQALTEPCRQSGRCSGVDPKS